MPEPTRSSKKPSAERRQHQRVGAAQLPFHLADAQGPLRVRDISHSGMAFFSEDPINVMTQVRFAFEVPGVEPAQTAGGEGVVVRCERVAPALQHYEVALFFTELEPLAKSVLGAYIKENLPRERSV